MFIFDLILFEELDGLECYIELDNYLFDFIFESVDEGFIVVNGEK